MTEPFLGEVQIFGFNFAPYGWALCNGATLQISQSATLFSLIGTQYGGNGTSNFQLPNLVNRSPCSQGQGLGLTARTMGETFGEGSVTLTLSEIPQHTHTATLQRTTANANKAATPAAGYGLYVPGHQSSVLPNAQPNTTFAANMIGPNADGGQPHDNHQPFLAVNFCISLQGVFPAFN
ncbi:MAG TPA: tail fiber protein [Aliidongia sp.]|nr:tail fiber protein [Aliidongia sp.]